MPWPNSRKKWCHKVPGYYYYYHWLKIRLQCPCLCKKVQNRLCPLYKLHSFILQCKDGDSQVVLQHLRWDWWESATFSFLSHYGSLTVTCKPQEFMQTEEHCVSLWMWEDRWQWHAASPFSTRTLSWCKRILFGESHSLAQYLSKCHLILRADSSPLVKTKCFQSNLIEVINAFIHWSSKPIELQKLGMNLMLQGSQIFDQWQWCCIHHYMSCVRLRVCVWIHCVCVCVLHVGVH